MAVDWIQLARVAASTTLLATDDDRRAEFLQRLRHAGHQTAHRVVDHAIDEGGLPPSMAEAVRAALDPDDPGKYRN